MSSQLIADLVVLVDPDDSLFDTAKMIASKGVSFYGIAVVTDEQRRVVGVINDGDFLKLIANGEDLTRPVKEAMQDKPIMVNKSLSHEGIIEEVRQQLRERNEFDKESVRFVLIVDDNNKLVNVFRFVDLLSYYKRFGEKVAVYGQGFVGLTLSAALANRGHTVFGVDKEKSLIDKLKDGCVHIHEPGLKDIIKASIDRGALFFKNINEEIEANIYIVAVGTPIDDYGDVDLSSIKSVCKEIASLIKRGDLIMLRSTVPSGTTRNIIKPLLEELSGYKAGHDFHLAFTPERTVEGKAMAELRSLPQIVGGLTAVCTQKASTFWGTLTDSVVHVQSLEAAELIKLINNSYRDLSFSFSNAFALLCDKYNIDAFQVINSANEGYPRNKIPSPSPGVGGYCLSKDPYLYAADEENMGHAGLSRLSREINNDAALYPINVLERYMKLTGRIPEESTVLIVGLAFKGWPETNDVRGSASLIVADSLKYKGYKVIGWDAVLSTEEVHELGLKPVDIYEGSKIADAILILNNHPGNAPEGLISICKGREVFLFDGWSMLDQRSVEQIDGIIYSTMGYMSELETKDKVLVEMGENKWAQKQ